MKKFVCSVSILCLLLKTVAVSANDQALPANDYKTNYQKTYEHALGYSSQKKSDSTIHLSMLGWGVGLAIGIAILSGVIHQSKHESAKTPTTGGNGT